MEEMNLTEEQIKEFWEWCGFKDWRQFQVTYPDGFPHDKPELDLNSLFEWAVPNLVSIRGKHEAYLIVSGALSKSMLEGVTFEFALFWAIYKVINREGK